MTDLIIEFGEIYSQDQIQDYENRVNKVIGPLQNQIFDAIEMEEHEEGLVTYESLKSAFHSIEVQIDPELLDYILFYVFKHSKNSQEMKYGVI